MTSFPLHSSKEENYIIELFKLLLPYKWLISSFMLLFILLGTLYLYVTPYRYQSNAIINVKTDNKALDGKDFLRESLLKTNTAGLDQEIAFLKTYRVNEKALNHINFQLEYFDKIGYLSHEIYSDLPFKIDNISKINKQFIGKIITVLPEKGGFSLVDEGGDKRGRYFYGESLETLFFTADFSKNRAFTQPIYIKLNGDNRTIYENKIKMSLGIDRIEENTNLINISFQDTIPQRADDYVNALITSYIDQSLQKKENTNNKILEFLEDQLERTQEKLEVSEQKLEQYQSKNESIDPSIKSTNIFEKLSDIDLELSEINLKEQLISNINIYIKKNKSLDAIAPTLLEFDDQSTIKLIDGLNELQSEEDKLKIEFTNNYPRLIQIRKRIGEIRSKVVLNIQSLNTVLVAKQKNLLKQKVKYESILTTLPKKEKKLITYKRNYEVNSKMYTYLLEKKSENELIKVASISDYEAVDKAYTSPIPISPKRAMVLIVFALIGLALGIFIALMRSLMVDKVQSQKQVELLTKLPIYGNIPLYKEKLLMNSSLAEAYRKLAMNLQFFKKENEGNIVLVSSMIQGEGKTTTLVNLSYIFENTQYKAIIIDLDMHTPSLHRHFGLEQQYSGVSTYLSQRDNLGNVVFTTSNPNVNIIPSGPTPPNPIELMLSPKLGELFTLLKREYDYIFIDTGSLDIATETFHLMQYSDMNLMVFREGVSRQSSISDLERIVRERGLQQVGLVLKTHPKVEKKVTEPDPKVIENQKPIKLII